MRESTLNAAIVPRAYCGYMLRFSQESEHIESFILYSSSLSKPLAGYPDNDLSELEATK